MSSVIEKWQASAIVLATILALVVLAIVTDAPPDLVVGALAGIPGLVLGAGAVAHGSRLAARSAVEQEERIAELDHRGRD
jgi:hypothetical protein